LNGAQNAPFHRVIDSPDAARAAVAELREAGVDFLKTHNVTEREPYFALLESARQAGLAVAGHVPVHVTPLEACRAGQASIEHIATLFEGTYLAGFGSEMEAFLGMGDWVASDAPELVRCFAEQQTLFVPTLRAYELRAQHAAAYDLPDPGWRFVSAELYQRWRDEGPPTETDRNPQIIALRQSLVEVGQTVVRLLHQAGAPLGTGTDLGIGILPGYDLHREIELFVEAGLTPAEAIWTSAHGPGERFGGDPLDGRLVQGAPANLVLLRGDAFADVSALATIETVVLAGRPIDRRALDGVLQGLAEDGPETAPD
jgi:imidazolonepropionase-like amidohydrolase